RVTRWLDRAADPARDLPLAATLMERGGTGGALFRAVYRDFLTEAAAVTGDARVRRAQRMYAGIAPLWTAVADHIATAGRTGDASHLTRASAVLADLAVREREAMTVLAAVDAG
ncbi:DUF4872 domain-containing protein, partial [Micromonospora aurantiaca]|nr:DUF4872 domain-containing protein [Micromonospora aurantiaca]